MADVIETIIQSLITAILGGASGSARLLALVAQGALLASLSFALVLRPILSLVRGIDATAVRPMAFLWTLLVAFAVVGLWLGFEVWPAMVLAIGFCGALAERPLGILGRLPSLKRLPFYSEAMRTVYVARYQDLRRSKTSGFWGSFLAGERFRRARETTLIAVVLDLVTSGVWLSVLVGLIVQPVGTLMAGRGLASVPRDVFVSIGTSMVSVLIAVGYGVQGMLLAVGERAVEVAPPTDEDVARARTKMDEHAARLAFSPWTVAWKLGVLLLVGGVASGLALSQR